MFIQLRNRPLELQVINEWKLEKDGVDVSLTDIANQTRDSQLDDRSTFLGLGPKRYVAFRLPPCDAVFETLELADLQS